MTRFDDIYFSSLEKISDLESDNTWIAKEVRPNGQVYFYVVDIKVLQDITSLVIMLIAYEARTCLQVSLQ